MDKCRWCDDEVAACPQENHDCDGGRVHLDGTHECGWLQYIGRMKEKIDSANARK